MKCVFFFFYITRRVLCVIIVARTTFRAIVFAVRRMGIDNRDSIEFLYYTRVRGAPISGATDGNNYFSLPAAASLRSTCLVLHAF